MNKIVSNLSRLGFWPFVLLFTTIAIIISEILILLQNYWFTGNFVDKNLLIIGFITPAISGFITFTITAFIIRYFVDKQKKYEETKDMNKLFYKIFTQAQEGILITDSENFIIDVNEAFTRITGYQKREVLGEDPRILKSGQTDKELFHAMWDGIREDGFWHGELWNKKKNGQAFAENLTISTIRDSNNSIQHYVGIFTDTTYEKIEKQLLQHDAHYDTLTNLPNRILLADRIHQGMLQAKRRKRYIAIAYIDLDGFKKINDTHGHEIGDKLLVHIALLMKSQIREGDTLSRLAGDEFLALLIDIPSKTSLNAFFARLIKAMAQPIEIDSKTIQISASIGVTFYPQSTTINIQDLISQGDKAMYRAKELGKNRYFIFNEEEKS